MKIAINNCFGGFGLSELAIQRIKEMSKSKHELEFEHYRDNPLLIKVIEELGEKANGTYAELKIVEIPDGINWVITEYDGMEHVAENHQTWS